MIEINGTTACFPGLPHAQAVRRLYDGAEEVFGPIRTKHIQLCPQNAGRISQFEAAALRTQFPETQFRLHANVRLLDHHVFADAGNAQRHWEYFRAARPILDALGSNIWSIHAGRRAQCPSLEGMQRNINMLEDYLGCEVAVEGLYPEPQNRWLLSTWDDYVWLLESELSYALDMSHLMIVAHYEARFETLLVHELLASPNCVEIHVSVNDGTHDSHDMIYEQPPFWWEYLAVRNKRAVIFTEGNQLRTSHAAYAG